MKLGVSAFAKKTTGACKPFAPKIVMTGMESGVSAGSSWLSCDWSTMRWNHSDAGAASPWAASSVRAAVSQADDAKLASEQLDHVSCRDLVLAAELRQDGIAGR